MISAILCVTLLSFLCPIVASAASKAYLQVVLIISAFKYDLEALLYLAVVGAKI